MHVEDVLAGRFTVCEKQVHAFAPQRRVAESRRGALSGAEQLRAVLRIELRERRGVRARHDEQVPAHVAQKIVDETRKAREEANA